MCQLRWNYEGTLADAKKRPLLRSLSLYQFQTINQINALRKKLKISYSDSNV